ncbi:hypothetical protein [Granulicella sibirica]|nr:hypothetical protein [Granulicella sibirica]
MATNVLWSLGRVPKMSDNHSLGKLAKGEHRFGREKFVMENIAASLVGTDMWNAEVYGGLSVASRMSATIRQGRNTLKIRWAFMRLNGIMTGFLEHFYLVLEGKVPASDTSAATEMPSADRVERAMEGLWNLHHAIEGLYDTGVRKGFRQRTLLRDQMATLEKNKELLVDMIQWLSQMTDSEEMTRINELFDLAEAEIERGETVALP